jgi:predicted ABC-type ATPase
MLEPWDATKVKRKRKQKRIIIIAGPNGAGKTTFARRYLPRRAGFPDFINADLIARGLSPFAPDDAAIEAGRIMLSQIHAKVSQGRSFMFETTLAARTYASYIPKWRDLGYHVKLIFLSLPSAEVASSRVKMRVLQGGHAVPEGVIRRRFEIGQRNLDQLYTKLVNAWDLYDNSGPVPQLVAHGRNR